MREAIAEALKAAMKSHDKARTGTLRLIQSAIKDRDIANRGAGKEAAGERELVEVLSRMVKQRQESAKAFEDGGRPELAAQERAEIATIGEFLPRQMDEAEMGEAIRQAIAATGAAGVRDMGKVMAELKARHAGQMDFGKASAAVKQFLG